MRAIVTCGPSYEPIDEVRRITNFSTGELGTLLATALVQAGVETICLRGVAATWAELPPGADVRPFTTNDDLARQLQELSRQGPCAAVYHTAALADFRVTAIRDAAGRPLLGAKISSAPARLTLDLEPATKLLPHFRAWFPTAHLIGWKYELNGTRDDALAAAARQITRCQTNACVVNGRAYGPGFGLLHPDGSLDPFDRKQALSAHLLHLLLEKK